MSRLPSTSIMPQPVGRRPGSRPSSRIVSRLLSRLRRQLFAYGVRHLVIGEDRLDVAIALARVPELEQSLGIAPVDRHAGPRPPAEPGPRGRAEALLELVANRD